MTLNCWIVDDEPLAQSLLESYVQKTPFLKLTGKFSSAIVAVENIKKIPVDIIFLDIQMPDLNGLEFSKLVPQENRIIFTTAFSEFAIDGYKVNAIDYLLKPFSYSDFLSAAKKAQDWFEITQKANQNEEETGFFVKSEYKLVQVLFDEILFIEGLKDYVKIHTTSHPKPIITLMNLKNLEEILPAEKFIRVHRSFIISKNKIENLNKSRIIINGHSIPIGETYQADFLKLIGKNSH